MKKILSVFILSALLLTGCAGNENQPSDNSSQQVSEAVSSSTAENSSEEIEKEIIDNACNSSSSSPTYVKDPF